MPERIDGAATPSEIDVFDVAEDGALSVHRARVPDNWRKLFLIDDRQFADRQSLTLLADDAPPLSAHLQQIAERDCEELNEEMNAFVPDESDDQIEAVFRSLDASAAIVKAVRWSANGWQVWMNAMNEDGFRHLQTKVSAWLDEPVDFAELNDCGLFMGPRGDALRFFEDLPGDELGELGVELVYGGHFGGTYFAAELTTDFATANARAAAAGIPVRFVRGATD